MCSFKSTFIQSSSYYFFIQLELQRQQLLGERQQFQRDQLKAAEMRALQSPTLQPQTPLLFPPPKITATTLSSFPSLGPPPSSFPQPSVTQHHKPAPELPPPSDTKQDNSNLTVNEANTTPTTQEPESLPAREDIVTQPPEQEEVKETEVQQAINPEPIVSEDAAEEKSNDTINDVVNTPMPTNDIAMETNSSTVQAGGESTTATSVPQHDIKLQEGEEEKIPNVLPVATTLDSEQMPESSSMTDLTSATASNADLPPETDPEPTITDDSTIDTSCIETVSKEEGVQQQTVSSEDVTNNELEEKVGNEDPPAEEAMEVESGEAEVRKEIPPQTEQ